MLMNIQCSADPRINVRLTFDDNTTKTVTVSKGDLVDVEYNKNGVRRRIEGKVVKISTSGTQTLGWCIIIDGSGDFAAEQARITPNTILDIDIIRRSEYAQGIDSPKGKDGILGLKVVKGRLLYTQNGYDWYHVIIDREDVMMDSDDGSLSPDYRPHHHKHHHDGIKPEEGGWDDEDIDKDQDGRPDKRPSTETEDGEGAVFDDEIKEEVY